MTINKGTLPKWKVNAEQYARENGLTPSGDWYGSFRLQCVSKGLHYEPDEYWHYDGMFLYSAPTKIVRDLEFHLNEERVNSIEISGRRFTKLYSPNCSIVNSTFTDNELAQFNLNGTRMASCDFARTHFVSSSLDLLYSEECDFSECNFNGGTMLGGAFINGTISGATFYNSNLLGVLFEGCDFTEIQFSFQNEKPPRYYHVSKRTTFVECEIGFTAMIRCDMSNTEFVDCTGLSHSYVAQSKIADCDFSRSKFFRLKLMEAMASAMYRGGLQLLDLKVARYCPIWFKWKMSSYVQPYWTNQFRFVHGRRLSDFAERLKQCSQAWLVYDQLVSNYSQLKSSLLKSGYSQRAREYAYLEKQMRRCALQAALRYSLFFNLRAAYKVVLYGLALAQALVLWVRLYHKHCSRLDAYSRRRCYPELTSLMLCIHRQVRTMRLGSIEANRLDRIEDTYHDKTVLQESPAKLVSKVFLNVLFELTVGYGDKPFRAVITSGVVWACFGAIFFFIGAPVQHSPTDLRVYGLESLSEHGWEASVAQPLVLSLQCFSTLGFFWLSQYEFTVQSVVAALECLVGVLLAALFIWSLSRQITLVSD